MKPWRRILPWIVLAIYWPTMFVSTHIPRLPNAQIFGRDVTLHFGAYLLLGLFFWLARYGTVRPRLTTRAFWVVMLIMAAYGAVDEASQELVPNRDGDPIDWLSDVCGALAGLVLLMVLRRWRDWLILYWAGMFVITHWPDRDTPFVTLPEAMQPYQISFVFLAYLALTMLWWRTLCSGEVFIITKRILLGTLFIMPLYALFDMAIRYAMHQRFDMNYLLAALAGIAIGVMSSAAFARHHQIAETCPTSPVDSD